MTVILPRPEHPRPDFVRPNWTNLNGEWQFSYDDNDRGMIEKWYRPGIVLDRTITVPFCYQCELSGVNEQEYHPILWYRRSFDKPQYTAGHRILLRFGAVDFACAVYVSGQCVGTHKGGYVYTQLTDVQQEQNGLLTPDRRPKIDVERFRKLNRNPDGKYQ